MIHSSFLCTSPLYIVPSTFIAPTPYTSSSHSLQVSPSGLPCVSLAVSRSLPPCLTLSLCLLSLSLCFSLSFSIFFPVRHDIYTLKLPLCLYIMNVKFSSSPNQYSIDRQGVQNLANVLVIYLDSDASMN